jgi:hypothetical protein
MTNPLVTIPRVRSFRRRLFASVSVLSLFLCLATVGLWVRSYWREHYLDYCHLSGRYGTIALYSELGRLRVHRFEFKHYVPPMETWIYLSYPSLSDPYVLRPMFQFERYDPSESASRAVWTLVIPHWLPAILFAFAPAYWLLGHSRRQSKRRKLGLCLNCGYDLRASPERCPECGAHRVA